MSSAARTEQQRQLLVVAGEGPEPAESFIRRDLQAWAAAGWSSVVAGLNQRHLPPAAIVPAAGKVPAGLCRAVVRSCLRLARHAPRQALALARSYRLVQATAAAAASSEVVVAQFAWLTCDVAAIAAEVAGRPLVVAVHAWDIFTQPAVLIRQRLATAAAVVACSAAAHERLLQLEAIPSARLHLIHHGLPLEEFPCRREQPTVVTRIVAVGRLEAKKGFDLLLRALVGLEGESQLQLDLVGEGRERQRLELLADKLGVRARVVFHGALTQGELRPIMAAAGLLVLPSRRLRNGDRDGIANVLLEAMALGVPLVTTTAGGAAEVVTDGVNGLLVAPDSVAQLRAAITKLCSDLTLRQRLAGQGRATVVTHFALPESGRRWAALFECGKM